MASGSFWIWVKSSMCSGRLTRRESKDSVRTRFSPSMRRMVPAGDLPAVGRPARFLGVEPAHDPEVLVDLEEQHAVHRFLHRIEQRHPEEPRVRRPVPDLALPLQVPGNASPDLDVVHLLGLRVQLGQRRLLEDDRGDADRGGGEQDREADAVEADARGLEGIELALPGEGQEQEHGGDEHDERQALVQLGRQVVGEVLDDQAEGGLDPQESVEGLEQVHDDEEHGAHAEAEAEEHQVLADEVAVDEEGRRARPPDPPDARAPRARPGHAHPRPRLEARPQAPEHRPATRSTRPRSWTTGGSTPSVLKSRFGSQMASAAGRRRLSAMPSREVNRM